MARAVGVGGVFLKAQDPKALSAWYAKHFGIASADKTSLLFDGPSAAGMTVFAHFPRDTEYSQQAGQQVPSRPWSTCGWTISMRCSRNLLQTASLSTPSGKTIPTAASPGSSIPKAIASNCGSRPHLSPSLPRGGGLSRQRLHFNLSASGIAQSRSGWIVDHLP
jgi:hypothetical protein